MQRIELEPVDVPKAPSNAAPGIKLAGGNLILVSGQVAWDAAGNVVGKGDIVAQTRQAFANLERIFAAAEATLADVVKLTIYITDLANRHAVREIRREFLGDNTPPSTTVVVSSLVDEDLLVEIERDGPRARLAVPAHPRAPVARPAPGTLRWLGATCRSRIRDEAHPRTRRPGHRHELRHCADLERCGHSRGRSRCGDRDGRCARRSRPVRRSARLAGARRASGPRERTSSRRPDVSLGSAGASVRAPQPLPAPAPGQRNGGGLLPKHPVLLHGAPAKRRHLGRSRLLPQCRVARGRRGSGCFRRIWIPG